MVTNWKNWAANAVLIIGALAAAGLLTGCVDVESIIPKPNMNVAPVAFPYPGIYTSTVTGGTMTYRIDANGRGLSCIRTLSGRVVYGDVIYDGATLHTEDGDLDVVSASPSALKLRTPHMTAELRKVETPPTVCVDFLKR